MIPVIDVKSTNPVGFYDGYELTDEEIAWLAIMAEEGNAQEAVDVFIDEYILPPGTKYSDLARHYIELSSLGVIEEKQKSKMIRTLALLSMGLAGLLYKNYSKFIKGVYADSVFKNAGLEEPDVEKSIVNDVLSEYEQSISGTMLQTQAYVLNSIRTMQREIIVENMMIEKSGIAGEMLDKEMVKFQRELKAKYPDIYKAMQDGNILVTKSMIDGEESIRHYKLDYYFDLSTRTILLNIDRTTNLIMAQVDGDNVVEYAEIDPRIVTKDREICQEVLANKINGKSLLALDAETAQALGIMTVDELLANPQGATSNGCRHGFLQCSRSFLEGINKLL
jgi:hypothetical protein